MRDVLLVVGGGPAGLAAAASLAKAGHAVRLVDRLHRSGRRKLCGEFLSGDAGRVLRDLGCHIGPDCPSVDRLLLSDSGGRSASASQSGLGWGCSRERLIQRLQQVCQDQGVEIVTGERVTEDDASGYRLALWATGHAGASRTSPNTQRRGRWLAVAVHGAGHVEPGAVQLHMTEGGYAGIGMIEGGRVNLCALLPAPRAACDPLSYLLDMCERNPLLRNGIDTVSWDSSTVAVQAGLDFQRTMVTDPVLRIGDAAAAPAPLLGQGLAAALQGGQLMAKVVDRSLRAAAGQDGPDVARIAAHYRRLWHREFGTRLHWGRWLQAVATRPILGRLAVFGLSARPQLSRRVIEATRGPLPA